MNRSGSAVETYVRLEIRECDWKRENQIVSPFVVSRMQIQNLWFKTNIDFRVKVLTSINHDILISSFVPIAAASRGLLPLECKHYSLIQSLFLVRQSLHARNHSSL